MTMKVTFWGVRGSIATPGIQTVRYGGNTSCVQLTASTGDVLILDSGTGLRALGQKIIQDGGPREMALLITHTHWDHIQGFPFFAPVYSPAYTLDIYGPRLPTRRLEDILTVFMDYEFHPVRKMELAAQIRHHDLGEETFHHGPFTVTTCHTHHPVVSLAYRVECGGKAVVYTGDHEPYFNVMATRQENPEQFDQLERAVQAQNQRIVDFAKGAHLLIADAQYTVEEYEQKRLWGHSSMEASTQLGIRAGIPHVALFHHDPTHSDDFLDELARVRLPRLKQNGTFPPRLEFAREGQEIVL